MYKPPCLALAAATLMVAPAFAPAMAQDLIGTLQVEGRVPAPAADATAGEILSSGGDDDDPSLSR